MFLDDWRANAGSIHVQVGLALLRLAQLARKGHKGVGVLPSVLYRCYSFVVLSMDIPTSTRIGKGLRINHGQGLVIHSETVIGCDVTLRQGVTIGTARRGGGAPRIGDRVDIGASALIIGDISIGEGAQIGAGAVVVGDVPAGAVAVGNPARVLIKNSKDQGAGGRR
jgi:serine O-acetyltransferase/putative colanic acid biosynthesis acetyltransferase WcaB